MGFSIIFPLFPELLDYYLVGEGTDSLFGSLHQTLVGWAGEGPGAEQRVAVLFGGLLGSLYSLLQFIASPLWGRASDRIGRRPVLLLTIAGMVLSYAIWLFSTSFAAFVVSRLLGGAMAGNISAATAAMADVTTREDRAKGMGIVGAAFGLGFIVGPGIGAALVQLDPGSWGSLAEYTTPFSAAAAGALLLSLGNWVWVWRKFSETLPEAKRTQPSAGRPLSPKTLLFPGLGPHIARLHIAYFLFLVAFSGMEFTLSFLVRDRLGWSAGQIGMMFVGVGLVLATVQGGVVRRVAPIFGEKRVAVVGLVIIIPGLLLLGLMESAPGIITGLLPMAVGSALAIPTLTALVSLFAPETEQGRALGVFRSLGALSRAVGPLLACWIYFQFGAAAPYIAGAALLLVPPLILGSLPVPEKTPEKMPEKTSAPEPAE